MHRLAIVVIGIAIVIPRPARACPSRDPARGCFTLDGLTFEHVGHTLTLTHVADVTATGTTAGDGTVDAAAGLGLTYVASFDRGGKGEYVVSTSVGAMAHRLAGAVEATGASTHAELRLGPAVVADGDAKNRRMNTVTFPLTFELSHDGELAALPRLGARPDVARARYGWQHVELATRLVRMESEGSQSDGDKPVGPGGRNTPIPMALDFVTFHGALDVTSQDDGHRLEGTVGGALMEVTSHDAWPRVHLAVVDLEHRAVSLPGDASAAIDTVWIMRVDLTSPRTGTRYTAGWGTIVEIPGRTALERELDIDDGNLDIGSLGWWHERAWGGVGWQYQRAPYVTMAAQPAVEDRWSIEGYRTGTFDVRGALYLARTRRWIADAWLLDTSGGLAVDVHRRVGELDVTLATEVGRTYYGALDGAAPTLGLAGRATLTIQHADSHAWQW